MDELELGRCKNDFPRFVLSILGYEQYPNHWHDWFDRMTNNKYCVTICSRDHGKSYYLYAWALWKCVFCPDYEIVYCSYNQRQTNDHMKAISKLIQRSKPLRKFIPSKGYPVEEITLTNGSVIKSRSSSGTLRGLHPDEVIVDDPLRKATLGIVQAVNEWFFEDMLATLHHSSRLTVKGTPFTYTDLYQKISEKNHDAKALGMEAEYNMSTYPALNESNEPLWPWRWSYEELKKREMAIGRFQFAREYMCQPINIAASIFHPHDLENMKDETISYKREHEEGYRYFIGYDPAMSRSGDYTVMVVLKVDEEGNRTLVHMTREKGMGFRQHIDEVIYLSKIFDPVVILIETNTFAKAFFQELRDITDFPVQEFVMGPRIKEDIIFNLQMNINNKKFKVPYKSEYDKIETNKIIEELNMFGINNTGKLEGVGAHDDIVIALALANHAIRHFSETFHLLDDMGIFEDETPSIEITTEQTGLTDYQVDSYNKAQRIKARWA